MIVIDLRGEEFQDAPRRFRRWRKKRRRPEIRRRRDCDFIGLGIVAGLLAFGFAKVLGNPKSTALLRLKTRWIGPKARRPDRS
jgi:hypothetical protein